MKHARQNEITAHLDGALSPEKGKRLLDHLAQCERCRSLEEEIRRERDLVDRAFRGLDPSNIPAPPEISRPTGGKVHSFSIPKTGVGKRYSRIAAAALLLAAAALSAVLILSVAGRHPGVSYAELEEHALGSFRAETPAKAAGRPMIRSVRAGGRAARAYIIRDRDTSVTFVWIERSIEKDGNHENIL